MSSFLRLYRCNGYRDWTGASELAASAAGKGSWLARKIREWTHCLIQDETDLPTHSYGKFNSSILEDEDITDEIQLHLQTLGPWFSAIDIVRFMNSPEMQARLKLKKSISVRTAQRWLIRMSWRWTKEPKSQYKDGHEREDIVKYRQTVFLPAMTRILPHLCQWNVDGSPIPNENIGREQYVFWSHDESTFYANDRRKIRWVHQDEGTKPYAKGEGISLMVVDFVSADFGWLKSPNGEKHARQYFKAGKNRDGYFDNHDILAQASHAMDILDHHYPDYTHILAYDNATIHRKRRPNAISAQKMTVAPTPSHKPNFLCNVTNADGSITKVKMDEGTFHDGTPQSFYFPDDHPTLPGRFKGMQQIIRERFTCGTPNIPNPDAPYPRTGKKINGQCPGFKCEAERTDCCLRRILYCQPDFANQKSALEELCEARGYQVLFFPKFHCELNSIEQSWGFSKRVYREFPASFFTRTLRFMDAYLRGLNGQQAAWAAKKYRGHRVLPNSIMDELDHVTLRSTTDPPAESIVDAE
ncbi:hypothetical protein C8R42DRAFT_699054 [Lentinula raphanica]|nr:hypothetical protein C8R42DRAFT_699054 [Lentinula raphanica]